jgi:DNA polymerase-3 subunit gamma/tau
LYDTSNEVILTRINKLEEGLKNGSLKVVSNTTDKVNSKEEVTKRQQLEKPKE